MGCLRSKSEGTKMKAVGGKVCKVEVQIYKEISKIKEGK
jgi:hypothetical protein